MVRICKYLIIVEAQNLYIGNIRSPESIIVDFVAVNEFNLFGDPSLKIGGYYRGS